MRIKGQWTIVLGALLTALFSSAPLFALETSLSAKGAPESLLTQLTAASLSVSAKAQGLDSAQELLAAALSDYRTLVQVLYDQGYFSPVIHIRVNGREAANIAPLHPPANIQRIDITVRPGPLFRFGRANVTPLAANTKLPDKLPDGFRRGQIATTGLIRGAAFAAIDQWRNQGHALAKVAGQNITVNHNRATLNADIRLAPGPKLRFGQLSVPQDSAVRAGSIAQIAAMPSGQTFHPDTVQTVATRLRRTGAFSSVSIRQDKTANPDGTLDFTLRTMDAPQRKISFGAEISSDRGLDLSAKWTHRNLLGGAERFQFEARLSNLGSSRDVDGRLSFRLNRPGFLGADSDLFYLGTLERRNETYYRADVAQIAIGARRVFSDRLYGEVAIAPQYARVDDAFGARTFRLIAFPGRIELDQRDNKIDAHSGTYLEARVTPFVGLSGSKSGVVVRLDGRGYMTLGGSDQVVLAGRIQLGSVAGASLADIAPQFLFYSGGAGSVRGQPYQSLGIPVGSNTAGGRSMLALSAEIRTRVTAKISLVGFWDFGAIDAGSFVSDSSSHHSGAGFGLRYDVSGLGPLRVDVALPLSGTTGKGVQFYVGIGQAF